MSGRFPESKEERANRIARTAARMAAHTAGASGVALESVESRTLALPDVLERRMAARLATIAPLTPVEEVAALAAATARDGYATALRLSRGEVVPDDLADATLANLEAVIRVSDRPAWVVHDGQPRMERTDQTSEFWIARISTARKRMRGICDSVGCISIDEGDHRAPIGTGWLIAESTLITNAHVAAQLAFHRPGEPAHDPRGGWRLRPGVDGVIDFGFEHGRDRNVRARISEVLHVEKRLEPDLAIFRIEPLGGSILPATITLDLEPERPAGWPDTYVFVVGHPAANQHDDVNVAYVFGKLDATKRVSPGRLLQRLGETAIAHDCSTTHGSSGSPLVDLASYRAIGLHYFGTPGERNEAVFLPAMANHPAIVKSRSNCWGI